MYDEDYDDFHDNHCLDLVAAVPVSRAVCVLPKTDPRRALMGWAMPPERADEVRAMLARTGFPVDLDPPRASETETAYDRWLRENCTPRRYIVPTLPLTPQTTPHRRGKKAFKEGGLF